MNRTSMPHYQLPPTPHLPNQHMSSPSVGHYHNNFTTHHGQTGRDLLDDHDDLDLDDDRHMESDHYENNHSLHLTPRDHLHGVQQQQQPAVITTLLKRTPSGSLFIPSDNPMIKSSASTLDYKHNLIPAGSSNSTTPDKKHQLPSSDRCLMPFDTRLRMSGVRPQSSLFNPTSPHGGVGGGGVAGRAAAIRKNLDISSRCSWKCTAILLMLASAVLAAAVAYLTAAHFVNWPPQPAKPHILLDNDNVLQPIDDLINGTSSRRPPSGIATAAAGGNATTRVTQLVNALRRLMPRQQTHDSSSSSTSPFLLPQSSSLVRKRRQNDADVDDEAMWSLLLDWVAQEQQEAFVMADEARPPPPPLPFPSLLVESDPGSGDGGKVLKFVQSQVDPNPDDDDDEEEETEPASMAIAESLILLHPLAASAVDPPGRIKTVFAYDHPLVEIVQLDPFETSPPLKIPATFIDATDHVVAATAVNNSEDDDDDSMTSNETVPPDSRSDSLDVIWRQQGQEEETDLLATGTPPPSSILLSLAGNITEDILSLEPWSDVISYPGTPAPPSLAIEEENSVKSSCVCVCPSLSDSPPVTDPTTTTTVATTTEHQLIKETTTIEMATTILLPSSIEIVPQEEEEKEEQRGCPIVPTCPPPSLLETTTIPTTTTTMMTTTTALPIPPILILEDGNTFPARSFPPDGTTFSQVTMGERSNNVVPPYGYWNMQFYHSEAAYVRFELGVPRGASLALYARRNALPTHTHYDVLHLISGYNNSKIRAKRSTTGGLLPKEVLQYMEPGHWFVSLYNDDGDGQSATCLISLARDLTLNCPRGCSGPASGECILGRCQCKSGFAGDDCSQSVCPVLCSGRGDYVNGRCQCNPGWKGRECSLKHDECEVPDCSGHGKCNSAGKCVCGRGYKGEFCDIVDCPHPTCSDHGYCADGGVCVCRKGWKGPDCSLVDSEAMQCLPDCSGSLGQGSFSLELHRCVCSAGWTGDDCSKPACAIDCGLHGRCEASACVCQLGWAGEFCQERLCDVRCNEHGQCKNGTCLCTAGWNGKHCTLEGCPRECSKHGQCKQASSASSSASSSLLVDAGGWSCRCEKGWEGIDCNVALELDCDDGRDNDGDGLVDCEDSDCCQRTNHCKKSPFCVTAPKPIDILLRKQPPAVTASFYERMKFLIEEGSLQSYAKQDAFNESMFWSHFNASRAAVVRGKVVSSSGLGLLGVRVSSSNPLEGFTLTRDDGWFDLMVNGGAAVVIHFGRTPFLPNSRTVYVPWNEVVVLDTVTMATTTPATKTIHSDVIVASSSCDAHDYDAMRPVVLATWKHGFQGSCPARSAILAESQVVQESLQVPGTSAHLVYHSSRSAGYLSTIQLQLTPDEPESVPAQLNRIHLRITVEGLLFEKIFEADAGVRFTYAWNRFNVYRQRVYGVTTATVRVGYQYDGCNEIVWHVQTTKLSGHDMSISDIGGWNLDVHHRYNFHEGILQKGDGSNVYLRYRPEVLRTVMGDGHQRPLECAAGPKSANACEGPANQQRVLAPVALTASPDGSLYLGDFNLIRRIGTDGLVRTLLRLNTSRISYRYHMALSPVDNVLYLSDPEAHQIIRIRNMNDFSNPDTNFEPVVGSGERCLPGDEGDCGDGGPARDAKLTYPKGVAVAADGSIYFADGTNIRTVNRDGIISTIVGSHQHRTHWNPMPCQGTLPLAQVRLRWPTEIAINPLDNSLHIIDDHMIMRLTSDGRMRVVAGKPLHCPLMSSSGPTPVTGGNSELNVDTSEATQSSLVMPQSLAFGPSGDLYVAESDSQRINRVRRIGTDGRIVTVAGAESKCNCLDVTAGCQCYDEDRHLAVASRFNTISAIAVAPDNVLYVCDQANYRLRAVTSSPTATSTHSAAAGAGNSGADVLLAASTSSLSSSSSSSSASASGTSSASSGIIYEINSPETQEVYVFNRFGQHVATRSLVTGRNLYTFGYNVNTSNGKLSTVTDSAGNKIFLLRDYSNQVTSVENTRGSGGGGKCRLRMSRSRLLQEFSTPDGRNVTFDYHGSTGLLKSRTDSGRGQSVAYSYDDNGRLVSAVSPTGQLVRLTFDLSIKGASVQVVQQDSTNSSSPSSPVVYFISQPADNGWSVSRKVGQAEEVVSMQPDRSVTWITPFGHMTATETSPYSAVLADADAEMFPVPAKQRVEIGGELVSRLEWRYFVRRGRRSSGNVNGGARDAGVALLGKKLRVNGENLLTLEYDRESLSESVFMEDRAVELLNVTYDDMSRPVSWTPGNRLFAAVQVAYDRFGQLASWKQADLSETYNYDRSGRLSEVVFADGSKVAYSFRDAFTALPAAIATERGNSFQLTYDRIGAIQSVTTPRGHIHSFAMQVAPGATRFLYSSPASPGQPFQLLLDDKGRVQTTVYPAGSGQVHYLYDSASKGESRLSGIIAGAAETWFDYDQRTGQLRSAQVKQRPGYQVKHELQYHGGLVKEERVRFGSKTGLDDSRIRCKYDGNGRLALIETEVNGRELPPHAFSYNQNVGVLEGVNDLRVYRNAFNRTVVQDSTKHYFRVGDRDQLGRAALTLVNIKGYDAFKLELEYDQRGRVNRRKITIGGGQLKSAQSYNVTYNAEGGLLTVAGGRATSYSYTYDDNGNIVTMTEGNTKSNLIYDAADRVTAYGKEQQQQTVVYDGRGFVARRGHLRMAYNDLGQLTYASGADFRVWYNYDYMGRLAVWRDDKGNVTQFLYANPLKPHLLTHLHRPKESRTLRMYYDPSDHLMAIESAEQRWYVAGDEAGTPMVVFNVHGAVVKLTERTPFGRVVADSETSFYIGVDFRGGVLSPHTGLVHFPSGRVYDPSIAQWMQPQWQPLVSNLRQPQDVFVYRFRNNDPLAIHQQTEYRTSLESWLELFGYSWNNIVGPQESAAGLYQQQHQESVVGHFGVISGLRCLTENVRNGFTALGFVPPPRLRSGDEIRRNLLPAISYRKPALGEGLLLSRTSSGKVSVVQVHYQDSQQQQQQLQDVLGSVLGDSSTVWLDVRSTAVGQQLQETLYFVKESTAKLRDDLEDLQRLSGQFNVSVVDSSGSTAGEGSELRLTNSELAVSISYGVSVETARQRVLRTAHRRAVDAAWLLEKQLVESGLAGQQVDWSVDERVQLLATGRVDGFVGAQLHNISDYPQLADDPGNIVFRREDVKRKRRKSHHRRTRPARE